MLSNTQSATGMQGARVEQIIRPDYTGIYCFCGTLLLIVFVGYALLFKIAEKWREDNYKLAKAKMYLISLTLKKDLATAFRQLGDNDEEEIENDQ